MAPDLIDDFLRHAGQGEVDLVVSAIEDGTQGGVAVLEFNVYEVAVDHRGGHVTVADVLSADRVQRVAFAEFRDRQAQSSDTD